MCEEASTGYAIAALRLPDLGRSEAGRPGSTRSEVRWGLTPLRLTNLRLHPESVSDGGRGYPKIILPTTLCFAVCDQQPTQHTFLARSSGAGRLLDLLTELKQNGHERE